MRRSRSTAGTSASRRSCTRLRPSPCSPSATSASRSARPAGRGAAARPCPTGRCRRRAAGRRGAGAGGAGVRGASAAPAEPGGRRRELITLRAETALSGGWLARLLDGQRVLLPASHFFEWRGGGRQRQPMAIAHRDGLMAFAGVLGRWADPDTRELLPAVALLTCAPNPVMAEIHHRMPVVLGRGAWPRWLDPKATAADLAQLLVPCPHDALQIRPASPLGHHPQEDRPPGVGAGG